MRGTVSLVNEVGEALVTRRDAAPACDDPGPLVARMAADVEAALKREPTLNVGCVQDGAPEMWNLTHQAVSALEARGILALWNEGIDRFHVLERLGKGLEIVEPNPAERSRRLGKWNALLDANDSAIDDIERELMRASRELPGPRQTHLEEHLVYLENNKDRRRYVTLAKACLPVGSGVTESTAKTVLNQRAKNSGQRWGEPGLRGVLTLRAIHHSDRLPRFWDRFSTRVLRRGLSGSLIRARSIPVGGREGTRTADDLRTLRAGAHAPLKPPAQPRARCRQRRPMGNE